MYEPQHTEFTHPSHLNHLPEPKYEFLFHLECDMESFRKIGKGPKGNRMNVMFKGGSPFLTRRFCVRKSRADPLR
jgi:hypothetical protein